MATQQTGPRYSDEELARRGDEIYEREVLPHLHPEDRGKFIAIDIETGAFEMGANELEAADRLRARNPEAQIWFRRVGTRYTYRFGSSLVRAGESRFAAQNFGYTPVPVKKMQGKSGTPLYLSGTPLYL